MNNTRLLNVLIKQGFSFSFLKKSDEEAHIDFVKRNWPNSPRKADFFYNTWKYAKRSNDEINIVVCKFNNAIVGQIGLLPSKIVIKNQVHDCFWGCNFMIDKIYKNIGLGAAIEIYAMENYSMIAGTSPSEESNKYKQKLGWITLDGATCFFFPIKINDFLKIKQFSKGVVKVIDFASIFINPLWTVFNNIRLGLPGAQKWASSDQETIIKRIANRKKKSEIPYILHDKNFMDWRNNPPEYAKREMKFLVSENSDSYIVYVVSGNRISIFEHFFESKKDFASGLRFLMKKERTAAIGLLKIFANSEFEINLFKSFLLKPLNTKKNFSVYSKENLFEGINKVHVDLYDGDGLLS
jgi:hypothetical protein